MNQDTPNKQKTRRRARRRTWLRAIALILVLGALVLALLPQPMPVDHAMIDRATLSVAVMEEGRTRVRHRYLINPPVSGELQRISLRPGDPVAAGETVLALLRPQSPGFIDARSRSEGRARVEAADAILNHRETDLEAVGARLELAQSDFVRIERLYRAGSVPEQEFQTAANRARVLEIELRAGEFARQVAAHELEQARAAMRSPSELEAEEPEGDFEPYAGESVLWPVVSPVDGVVLQVLEENARVVGPDMPIMEVGDPRDLEVEIELLSSDAVRVRPGAPVEILHWGGDQPLSGRVSAVEPGGFTKVSALGVEEQRVKVRVDLIDHESTAPNLGDRFRVEGRIVIWSRDDVLRVPVGALFRRGNRWLVFVIGEDERVSEVEVTIGQQDGHHAQVLEGLKEGERVVLHPPDRLEGGMRVRRE